MKFFKQTGDLDAFPIYVTRPTADGTTGRLSVGPHFGVIALLLVQLVVLLWLVLALVLGIAEVVHLIQVWL